MRRTIFFVIAATVLAAVVVSAQEHPGAGRFDITIAPVGGMFFTDAAQPGQTDFSNYALTGSVSFNFHPRLALEGEFGNAIGVHQTISLGETVLADQRSPSMYTYNGNLIFHPARSDRRTAPYIVGGIGGMTMLGGDSTHRLALTDTTTFLTANAGGGLKWFGGRRWGVRGDYRLFAVRDKAATPEFFARDTVRYGHRVYGGLILNY